MKPGRRGYLDWLRGIAVLIMIGSHTIDSWTIVADRGRPAYRYALMIGGLGAPVFLFLAGPVLTAPSLAMQPANGGSAILTIGRVRRLLWRPASIIGLILIVLWFLS